MRPASQRGVLNMAVLAAGLLLAACGGGSTAGTPSTLPDPVVQAPRAAYDTVEYHADYGIAAMQTIGAYQAGLSGQGITVGVIDSGIDVGNPEFAGRLSPFSIDITTGSATTLQDEKGHGTAVAGIIAGNKDDNGSQGVAFDATILAIRTDDHADDCAADCHFSDFDIAHGVDYAVQHGARVINISLGGDSLPSPQLQRSMIAAANAGVVFVMAAGNDGAAAPNAFAAFAADPRVKGSILIAGATDRANALWDLSDKAGDAGGTRDVFVVAPGVGIRLVKLNPDPTKIYFGDGTSFAAPHVVGAIALLMQEFPNLSGREILSIILDTAQPLALGDAADYGQGLVDVNAAIQPSGTLTVQAASGEAVPLAGNLLPGTAMGGSFATAFTGALAFDAHNRAYAAALDTRLAAAPRNFTLHTAIDDMRYRSVSADFSTDSGAPALRVGFSVDSAARAGATTSLETHAAGFTPRPDIHMATPLLDGLSFSLASGSTAGPAANPVASLALTARGTDPASQISGWGQRASAAYAIDTRTDIGSSVFHGRREIGRAFDDLDQTGSSVFLRRHIGSRAMLGMEAGVMQEEGSVLGMTGTGVFDGFDGASTRYLQFNGRLDLGRITVSGAYMASRTQAHLNGDSLFTDFSTLSADSWSLTVLDTQFTGDGHRFGINLAQPLAVRAGAADLRLATGWADDAPQYETRHISLAAPARETSLEIFHRYESPRGFSFQSNFVYRRNPDNIGDRADEVAVFLQLATAL